MGRRDSGVPIETVSRLLGHTDLKTTQIYARITNQKISSDMEIDVYKRQGVNIITRAMKHPTVFTKYLLPPMTNLIITFLKTHSSHPGFYWKI